MMLKRPKINGSNTYLTPTIDHLCADLRLKCHVGDVHGYVGSSAFAHSRVSLISQCVRPPRVATCLLTRWLFRARHRVEGGQKLSLVGTSLPTGVRFAELVPLV